MKRDEIVIEDLFKYAKLKAEIKKKLEMGLTPVMSDTVEPAPGLGAVQVAAASHIGQRAVG